MLALRPICQISILCLAFLCCLPNAYKLSQHMFPNEIIFVIWSRIFPKEMVESRAFNLIFLKMFSLLSCQQLSQSWKEALLLKQSWSHHTSVWVAFSGLDTTFSDQLNWPFETWLYSQSVYHLLAMPSKFGDLNNLQYHKERENLLAFRMPCISYSYAEVLNSDHIIVCHW